MLNWDRILRSLLERSNEEQLDEVERCRVGKLVRSTDHANRLVSKVSKVFRSSVFNDLL